MTKWRMAMIGALILAFAAGIPVGWIVNPVDRPRDAERYNPSWLRTELELSETQKEQMREIWSRAAEEYDNYDHTEFARDQDDVVREMLTEEQIARYNEIESEFRQKRERRNNEKRARYKATIEETMAVLTEEQRNKFEELLEAQRELGYLPRLGGQRGRWKERR